MLHALFHAIASATHSDLARQIQYLKVENEILRGRLPRRIVATPQERALLLRYGAPLGRAINEVISIVSPRTFAVWLSRMSRRDGSTASRPPGRPRTPADIKAVVLRLAHETDWGYSRIHGELQRLGITGISRTTVANLIRGAGLPPRTSPGGGTWDQFVRAHRDTLWACDFFSRKVWTPGGLVEHFVLFFIHVKSRRVVVSPATVTPNEAWVMQQARNFLMETSDIPGAPTILLRDNDRKFTARFDALLATGGVRANRLPICSPNLNAYAERWVQSIKHECLDRFVVFGRRHLDLLVNEYADYYNHDRPHQALANRVPIPDDARAPGNATARDGPIARRSRLGGCLISYERVAA